MPPSPPRESHPLSFSHADDPWPGTLNPLLFTKSQAFPTWLSPASNTPCGGLMISLTSNTMSRTLGPPDRNLLID